MNPRRYKLISLMLALMLISNLFFVTGCGKNATPHPNQLSDFDGQVYDRLTEAQAALTSAKAQVANGNIAGTPEVKLAINSCGAVYNTTRASWITWRDIYSGTKPGDEASAKAKLTSDMASLSQAIAQLVKLTGGGK